MFLKFLKNLTVKTWLKKILLFWKCWFYNNRKEIASKTNSLATKEDLAKEIGSVKTEIANAKTNMIKWMFIFWIVWIAATVGFVSLYLKK